MANGINELLFNGTLAGIAPGTSIKRFDRNELEPVHHVEGGNAEWYNYRKEDVVYEVGVFHEVITAFRIRLDQDVSRKYTLQRRAGEACFSFGVKASFAEFVQYLNDLKIGWVMDLDSIGPRALGIRLASGTVVRYAFEEPFFGFYELELRAAGVPAP